MQQELIDSDAQFQRFVANLNEEFRIAADGDALRQLVLFPELELGGMHAFAVDPKKLRACVRIALLGRSEKELEKTSLEMRIRPLEMQLTDVDGETEISVRTALARSKGISPNGFRTHINALKLRNLADHLSPQDPVHVQLDIAESCAVVKAGTAKIVVSISEPAVGLAVTSDAGDGEGVPVDRVRFSKAMKFCALAARSAGSTFEVKGGQSIGIGDLALAFGGALEGDTPNFALQAGRASLLRRALSGMTGPKVEMRLTRGRLECRDEHVTLRLPLAKMPKSWAPTLRTCAAEAAIRVDRSALTYALFASKIFAPNVNLMRTKTGLDLWQHDDVRGLSFSSHVVAAPQTFEPWRGRAPSSVLIDHALVFQSSPIAEIGIINDGFLVLDEAQDDVRTRLLVRLEQLSA